MTAEAITNEETSMPSEDVQESTYQVESDEVKTQESDDDKFPPEYVKQLRKENQRKSEKAKNAEDRAQAAEEAAKSVERKMEKMQKEYNDRLVRTELKSLAIEYGMVDLDALALLDMSQIKLDRKGDIHGAVDAMDALKKNKAYLFDRGPVTTSNNASDIPAPEKNTSFSVMDLSDDDYLASRAKYLSDARRR